MQSLRSLHEHGKGRETRIIKPCIHTCPLFFLIQILVTIRYISMLDQEQVSESRGVYH